MQRGLAEFGGNKITVIFGDKDPSAKDAKELSKADETARMRTFIYKGVDHHFSGDALNTFMHEPHAHLFDQVHYL